MISKNYLYHSNSNGYPYFYWFFPSIIYKIKRKDNLKNWSKKVENSKKGPKKGPKGVEQTFGKMKKIRKNQSRILSYTQYKFLKIQLQLHKNSAGDLKKIEKKGPKKGRTDVRKKGEARGKWKLENYPIYNIWFLKFPWDIYIFSVAYFKK